MNSYSIDQVLDTSGLSCPLPLLKAKQALNKLEKGQFLQVIATDVGSVRDFKAYTDQSAHTLLESREEGDHYMYVIQRG